MRGKQEQANDIATAMRITPAHAGKTKERNVVFFGYRDHPRACGENAGLRIRIPRIRGSPPRMRGKLA